MNKLFIAGLLVCAVATIASIISTAIPYWLYISKSVGDTTASSYTGLWKACSKVTENSSSQSSCVNINAPADWLKAVQALMILGILAQALSTTLACLLSKYNSNKYLCISAILMAAFGGILVIIAVIVFGAKETDLRSHFSAGFYLAIISGVLSLVASSLIAISSRSTGGYSTI